MRAVRVLLGHHWRRHRAVLAPLVLGMFLFHWMITRVAPLASQTQAFQGMMQLMPPALVRVLGIEFFNARGFIGFGYEHPFVLILMTAWAIRVTAGALAGEIGSGTMDLLGSRPVSRQAIVAAALVTLLGGLVVIIAAGWGGTAVGLSTRAVLDIAPWPYLRVAAGCWLLFVAFGAVGLAISALRRQGGGAIGVTAGLIIVSFALDYLARAWQTIAWTRRFSLFMYYRPQELYASGVISTDSLVLIGVAGVAVALAFTIFARRDL